MQEKKFVAVGPSVLPYFIMLLWAVLLDTTVNLFLFLRPLPYGQAYVLDIWHYMPHAIYYGVYGLFLLALPFLLLAKFVKQAWWRQTLWLIYLFILGLSLFFSHVNNEVLRFTNMHLNADFFRTYLMGTKVPDTMWTMFSEDMGGANISLILLLVPVLFWVAAPFVTRFLQTPIRRPVYWIMVGSVIGYVALAILMRSPLFGSKNRQAKVAPPIIVLQMALEEYRHEDEVNIEPAELVKKWRETWLKEEGNKAWVFKDDNRPFLKTHKGECIKPEEPYHFIILSFESFRAKSLKAFNPEEEVQATPFMDEWMQGEHGAHYLRYITNGHPTIAGFMALHTSLLPHSNATTAKKFTTNALESYTTYLRRHGYEAAFFGGSDPDWDNQRAWLLRWYDSINFSPNYNEEDRLVMQDASRYLRERKHDKPFVLTAFLISNHVPFHLPEEKFKITDSKDLTRKILNTMHYDDDVLREFIASIENEPWFERTIILVTGDHGMDLGDRGTAPDYANLRREVTALPLIVHGKHPRLPRGAQQQLGSHIDIAPTILDLAGICDDNNFMGHSLLSVNAERELYAIKYKGFAVENREHSAYFSAKGEHMLFDVDDRWQLHNICEDKPAECAAHRERVLDVSRLTDYGYHNRLFDLPAP